VRSASPVIIAIIVSVVIFIIVAIIDGRTVNVWVSISFATRSTENGDMIPSAEAD